MNAAEMIAQAIEKLEGLRDDAAEAPWEVDLTGDYVMSTASESTFGSPGAWVIGDAISEADPILIVTLHRTIPALLGLLRVAANNPGCETDEEVALADAILGERT